MRKKYREISLGVKRTRKRRGRQGDTRTRGSRGKAGGEKVTKRRQVAVKVRLLVYPRGGNTQCGERARLQPIPDQPSPAQATPAQQHLRGHSIQNRIYCVVDVDEAETTIPEASVSALRGTFIDWVFPFSSSGKGKAWGLSR
ncbi:hypothetical protein E2C01_070004 [Portunus trituberculatus]|uniref:Uncharacterized protein n=1 Tax=Portunus trituberculatus TaxID=210409 RepID=A0A5B7I051_PORTR|nr:hypothetical protein [Portunus trituberculatus]